MGDLFQTSKRVLLVILDGFGINANSPSLKNAIRDAKKPYIDGLFADYPFTLVIPGGTEVGLPKGVAGNSEVGHINIGAGRPVRQDLVRINEAIELKMLAEMPKLKELIGFSRARSKRIHLIGLLSDGSVHSHINHLKELLRIFARPENQDLKVYFHAFMDGRDTPKDQGQEYIRDLCTFAQSIGSQMVFASMQGRSIGMDRDRRWPKIEHCLKTWLGEGLVQNVDPATYIKSEYAKDLFDEFITPVLFDREAAMGPDDGYFFINFRPDRAKQITLAMNDPKFSEFPVPFKAKFFLCMSPYIDDEVKLPILFDKEKVHGTLAEIISRHGLGQFKIAETEKYAHVTYFLNGGEETPFPAEERVLVASPREVATYDQKPEMSAPEVTRILLAAMDEPKFSLMVVNYANSDMVGHTGNYGAAVKAIEALDECMKAVVAKAHEKDVTVLITADHGNADQMAYEDGSPHTSHTEAPVPFCLVRADLKGSKYAANGGPHALKDIAPTILHLLGIKKEAQMTGETIFK